MSGPTSASKRKPVCKASDAHGSASQPAKGSGFPFSRRSKWLRLAGLLMAAAGPTALALVMREAGQLRHELEKLEAELTRERTARLHSEREWSKVAAMQPRADNLPWQEALQVARKRKEAWENSDEFINGLFDDPHRRFPDGSNTTAWDAFVRKQTPAAFDAEPAAPASAGEGGEGGGAGAAAAAAAQLEQHAPAFCRELGGIVIGADELKPSELAAEVRQRALRALTECGFVYLDNLIPAARVEEIRQAYLAFRGTDEAADFRYPCQGEGRVEHMLPFRAPFNASDVYADPRLMTILSDFFAHEQFKMELMTVITSPPGSGNQRWHQGWRYLFHPDERLPPFAAVVSMPLTDVSPEMGPTEMCPGKKLRFYHGYRCQDHLRMATTAGTIAIFDYKTLHRGPANEHPTLERAMISMVFSKMFFMNTEAIVNRGISLLQTLHQRRYWEQFTWHPRSRVDQFAV